LTLLDEEYLKKYNHIILNMIILYQKYIIMAILLSINILLSTTFIIYSDKWYVYIFILGSASLVYSFSSILLLGQKMISNDVIEYRKNSKNYLYVIPCYNESECEMRNTIDSLTSQRFITGDRRLLFIICDGKVTGSGNGASTDIILLHKILNNNDFPEYYQYTTWDNMDNLIFFYKGYYTVNLDTIPYILIIKNQNYGKRDSLTLLRRLCYSYNESHNNNIQDDFTKYINKCFKYIYYDNIDYIIGIDADTIFDHNCSYELIQEIEKDNTIQGCVGYVDVSLTKNIYSPFILYQYAEYMFAQCLKRKAQSTITNKVSCLSGCNQILRVSKETCGEDILNKFNYLPKEDENIFNHIRSYASEDRNHVCHMLSMYPYVKTGQNIKAIAYTIVPTSISVFLSQRRRWSLGANMNDILLVYLPGINIFERIAAFINCMTFMLTPFIFISTIMFIHSIVTSPSYLMLYLGILVIIPIFYALLIPIFINPLSFRTSMYFYISYLFFLITGSIVGICIYIYSIINIDIIKWGKTRKIIIDIKNNKNNNNDNNIDRYIDDEIYIPNTDSISRYSLV